MASLPCTAWCRWAPYNLAHGSLATVEKIKLSRDVSLEQLRIFGELSDHTIARGGAVAFEWSTGIVGWQLEILKAILQTLCGT